MNMSLDSSYIAKLEALIAYTEVLDTVSKASFSLEELAELWNIDVSRAKSIVKKLRREGFLKRTRRGRYKLTLVGQVLVKLYKRIRR